MIFNFFKKNKKISDETIRKAEENLKKIYEDGEKFELKMLKEMNAELRKEKLVKETTDQGSKISDQMTLDALKSMSLIVAPGFYFSPQMLCLKRKKEKSKENQITIRTRNISNI